MEVYEFEKCLLDRLDESLNVLSWKDDVIPSSQVRTEWAYFIELQVEPAGWQALWKIPRVICEELHVPYPTVVFGMVEQVLFKELKVIFHVQAVQDDDVHLADRHQVALEDLYATVSQENTELNVERTADCVDRLRFFYKSVWMPWDNDNDDDLNWVEKHLESRIRFCYDLCKRSIKRPLSEHIRTLLGEAKYIQQRREYIELDISDDDDLDATQKSQITDLMRLHLRLAMIRNEIEMLENPEMRRIYEEVKFDSEKHLKDARALSIAQKPNGCLCYVVTLASTFARQFEVLRYVEQRVANDCRVQLCHTLQECLRVCQASDSVYLSPGRHPIKFLEYLNDNGSITGVSGSHKGGEDDQQVVIYSVDDDSILLVFDGDFTLENIVLDCHNVRIGVLVKNGNVRMRNCTLLGDRSSSIKVGIQLSGAAGTKLTLEECTFSNFATAIAANATSSGTLTLSGCKIDACAIGLDLSGRAGAVHLAQTHITGASKCGIYYDAVALPQISAKYLKLKEIAELQQPDLESLPLTGDCEFRNCHANIYVANELKALIATRALRGIGADEIAGGAMEQQDAESKAMGIE